MEDLSNIVKVRRLTLPGHILRLPPVVTTKLEHNVIYVKPYLTTYIWGSKGIPKGKRTVVSNGQERCGPEMSMVVQRDPC